MNSWKARRPPAWDLRAISSALIHRILHYTPAVENVHEGNRKDVRLLGAGEIGNVGVERNLLLQLETAHNQK